MAQGSSSFRFVAPFVGLAAVFAPLIAALGGGVEPAKPAPDVQSAAIVSPTSQPSERGLTHREQQTRDVFNYLMKEYKGILAKSKDRLGHSLAIVGMARIPRGDATAELLSMLKNEHDPLVQMVCWQCLLARANGLNESEFKQWSDHTKPLVEGNFFRGDLRVPLLHMMALTPPDTKAKEQFSKMFATTNSMDPQDHPTINALGYTMKAWGDATVVEAIMARLSDINDAQRAEMVLHAAGANVTPASSHYDQGSARMWQIAQQDYAGWWGKEKSRWNLRGKTEDGEWHKLSSQYVPRVDMAATVDPEDKRWYHDLELKPPGLRTFGVGLLVDTTGSMGEVLVWLRSDIRHMLEAFGFVSLEPQITITFYRDFGDAFIAKTVPLTGNQEILAKALQQMDAKGGGDIPEAIREGLNDSLTNGHWPTSSKQPKAMVLIGDAPPHPQTQTECEKIVKDAAAKGFRLYAVKVHTGYEAPDLSAFDKLAAAGNGASLWADMRNGLTPRHHGEQPMSEKASEKASKRDLRPDQMRRISAAGSIDTSVQIPPGEWIVEHVLVDAINSQFADRIRPPVATLWQMLKDPTKETHSHFPPAEKKDPNKKPKPKTPKPPFDPQKQ